MPDGREPLIARTLASIRDIAAGTWGALAGGSNPFLAHAFLSALEDSGSATAATGWTPMHAVIEDSDGHALAAAPLYLKNHSYGEYVFDHAWADAYGRAGGRYYPKLLCAVPFTPATGPRLLVAPATPRADDLRASLAEALIQIAARTGVSSLHVNFPGAEDVRALAAAGYLSRHGVQYHWRNRGYRDFEDFLAALASRKRKAIRRERATVREAGVVLSALTGSDLREAHWDAFYSFYRDTASRKWGGSYLTRKFFSLLGERMADRVMLVLAEHDGRPVAGALNLLGDDVLYGRHWGCVADFRFLHFEACYYQAIEFAIARGLGRVEAGAQGEHKIQRGYLPETIFSFHWIANESFRNLLVRHLERERAAVATEVAELAAFSPYRRA
jgi:predicted N-acyltransferase